MDDAEPTPANELADRLIDDLRLLCAQPSSSGQADDLADMAHLVATLLRRAGLHVQTVPTEGAPVVLGWSPGQPAHRLLLYHHYDVAPPGPWCAWHHEPFQLGEREATLYARGVSQGKGPLAAHLHALRHLPPEQNGGCGVALVVEGEGLNGSPHLARVLAEHAQNLQIDGCLSVAGERDRHGRPFCYGGSKGLLRVRLGAKGPAYPLVAGIAASVPNPVWRLTWALNQIKGEDEDIRIGGFYDEIGGPGPGERDLLRNVQLDEAGRLEAWQLPGYLFGMSGSALVRAEVTLPTCNLAAFDVEPPATGQAIPMRATAQLDFQLVPNQRPAAIMSMLRKHLLDRGFNDILIDELPGGYSPVRTAMTRPLMQHLAAAGERVYGVPLGALPLGPFAQPLHILASTLDVPVAALGLARHSSAPYGPNEHIPIDDLLRHSQCVRELVALFGQRVDEVALNS